MDVTYAPKEQERVLNARMNGIGKTMSDAHFDEALFITKIMEDEIQTNGRFTDKLYAYAGTYASSKKNLSPARAEKIIRDLFEERTGLDMKTVLDQFRSREENLTDEQRRRAFPYASEVGAMIENGNKVSFQRALSAQAKGYALEVDITDAGAKRIMSEQFEAVNGQKLYDWGKEKEDKFYRPQIEAERAARKTQVTRSQTKQFARQER